MAKQIELIDKTIIYLKEMPETLPPEPKFRAHCYIELAAAGETREDAELALVNVLEIVRGPSFLASIDNGKAYFMLKNLRLMLEILKEEPDLSEVDLKKRYLTAKRREDSILRITSDNRFGTP